MSDEFVLKDAKKDFLEVEADLGHDPTIACIFSFALCRCDTSYFFWVCASVIVSAMMSWWSLVACTLNLGSGTPSMLWRPSVRIMFADYTTYHFNVTAFLEVAWEIAPSFAEVMTALTNDRNATSCIRMLKEDGCQWLQILDSLWYLPQRPETDKTTFTLLAEDDTTMKIGFGTTKVKLEFSTSMTINGEIYQLCQNQWQTLVY